MDGNKRRKSQNICKKKVLKTGESSFEEFRNPPVEYDFWKDSHEELLCEEGDGAFDQKIHVLNKMRKKNILCDIVVVAEDGTEFPAHKSILAGFSEYFFCLLNGEFLEKEQQRVQLKEIDSATLELIIEFGYTSRIEITEDNAEMLLNGSSYLRIANLSNRCVRFLCSVINVNNCIDFRALADCFSLQKFLSVCNKFIEDKFCDVAKTNKFLNLSIQDLLELVKNDEINVPEEEMVYNAVMSWVKHDIDNKRIHLSTVLKCVRLSRLEESSLFDVLQDPIFGENLECLSLIRNAIKSVKEASAGDSCDLDSPRTSFSAVMCVYVIGGLSYNASQFRKLASIECFHIAKKQWTLVSNMMATAVWTSAAVVANNKIYILGGYTENAPNATSDVRIYDINNNQWLSGTTMRNCVARQGAVLMDNKIYMVGGESYPCIKDGEYADPTYNSASYFSLEYNRWHQIKSMSQKRTSVSIAILNGCIYAVGGYCFIKRQRLPLNSIECYNVKTDSWKTVAPMNCNRAACAVAVLNNLLFVFGGVGDNYTHLSSAEVYDPIKDSWSSIASMSVPRARAGIFCHRTRIYIFGGWDSHLGALNSMEIYDFKTNSWTTCSETMLEGRHSFGLAVNYQPRYTL